MSVYIGCVVITDHRNLKNSWARVNSIDKKFKPSFVKIISLVHTYTSCGNQKYIFPP
jgi:hypothetical protein